MKSLVFVLVISISFLFMNCSDKNTTADKEEIVNVIKKNLKACQDEDLNSLSETMHSESPVFNSNITIIKAVFNQYDLTYELKSYKINKIDGDKAEVSYQQITKKISGPAFKNNMITGIHFLRKQDGKWKIFNSRIDKIDYLN